MRVCFLTSLVLARSYWAFLDLPLMLPNGMVLAHLYPAPLACCHSVLSLTGFEGLSSRSFPQV